MLITLDMVISGFVSKVVNDCVDVLKDKIKEADKNRKAYEQNIETRIYQVTIDALNVFTSNNFKNQDKLFDSAESILRGFKRSIDNNIDAVRAGLKMLVQQVTVDTCEDFLGTLCHEICKDENDVLYKEITMLQQGKMIEGINEGFEQSHHNEEQALEKLDYVIDRLDEKGVQNKEGYSETFPENRAEEYAQKWDKNVFLNDFKKRDKKKGENVKLREIYLEYHLPHYVWKADDEPLDDLRDLLSEYIVDRDDKKMLLILGQPGIGKSTLITWIMANLVDKKDDIFVYQFASDLEKVDWQGEDILNDIFKILGLRDDDLQNKILILDGFDEIHASKDRKSILNQLYQKLRGKIKLKNFSLVVTCREKYIYELPKIECDYITLQAWDDLQIMSFCITYGEVSKSYISYDKIQKILDNKKIFGIPLILYMVLALGISIEKNSSIVDVYDQMFSVDGGSIYDRCIKNSRYESLPHRIGETKIKKLIHLISQRIAFWIFENNPEEAFITKDKYEEICDDVIKEKSEENEDIKRDLLISNYFEPIRHCEGVGTDELHFVHRSIYEYFVVVYFFESIHKLVSKEKVAGKLGGLLKDGYLTKQMLEFIRYKFNSMEGYSLSDIAKEVFNIMLRNGMTYYFIKEQKKPLLDILDREMNVFSNVLELVHLWNGKLEKIDNRIVIYLQHNHLDGLNLRGVVLSRANLRGADLSGVDLREADLRGADLGGADLSGADLSEANLYRANLSRADLGGAHLNGANLIDADLSGAYLNGAELIIAYLSGADLSGADLSDADLSDADLSEVDLSYADLSGAYLSGANLNNTIFDDEQAFQLCR